ncbi:AbrB/MazE/SpoVT family DNA-binding domain-containing protein [Roseicella aquatilis]|uniref:AbrB/MazE/SpoVT family DNA-binding domain-containing protein n=1 Tax=Roseicella aquatilis TaxID=2527868 RepID=A0A4R4DKB8_9PROT|nr:AbrB/MazE/SpoVT family DNA-binding domain-containing protein [Roseicella aquatilis]TCZ60856.1 AbrB/MazE/SpoVT family DNA-binding domain-containing protein [Roseicella aquatilis]
MTTLKLRPFGNSVGVVLPKEVLTRLKVGEGDTLYVTETPDGVQLTPLDPALQEQLRVGREVMKKYRNVLRELAK